MARKSKLVRASQPVVDSSSVGPRRSPLATISCELRQCVLVRCLEREYLLDGLVANVGQAVEDIELPPLEVLGAPRARCPACHGSTGGLSTWPRPRGLGPWG